MVLESDDTCFVQTLVKLYYRFWYYHGFTMSVNSFEARKLVIVVLPQEKTPV